MKKSRYWTKELDGNDNENLLRSMNQDNLVMIIDKKVNRIIAYALKGFEKKILRKLKK